MHRASIGALNRHNRLKVFVITLEVRHHFLETRIMGGCSPPHIRGASGASECVIIGSCGRLPQIDPCFELAYVNKMDEYKSYLKGGEKRGISMRDLGVSFFSSSQGLQV